MFDHVALHVADVADTQRRLGAALAALGIAQTTQSPTFAAWRDFVISASDDEHPVTRRLHVAFVAPSIEAIEAFWEAGTAAGLRDDGPPGPRPHYSDDYHAAFLKDEAGNSFEAVRHGGLRSGGVIDHVAIRVADLAAATAFYRIAAAAAGFELRRESPERASFGGGASGGVLGLVAGPVTEGVHIAFPGDDDGVRRFHAGEVAAGAPDNGGPGERPQYHPGYYAAFVIDPDGNNIEVVNHHRE